MKWLVHLNEIDHSDANAALRQLSASVLVRNPEDGINPLLASRAAALLLWLIGSEDDDRRALDVDSGLENTFDYARDYLAKPSQSFFELERRHAHETLTDLSLRLVYRIQRVGDLWFDPAFAPPPSFVAELRAAALEIDETELDQHSGHTVEDHSFEQVQPALARCAPDILVDLLQRKMRGLGTCSANSRYWSGVRVTSSFLIAGPAERSGAKALRMRLDQNPESNDRFAAGQLLLVELHGLTALEQAETLIEAKPETFLTTFSEVLRPLSPDDADALIARHGQESSTARRDLLYVLANRQVDFSERALTWLRGAAVASDNELRSIAFRALALSDAERFGRVLFNDQWAWSPAMGHWESYYGSGALIEGTRDVPFDRVAPRIAPCRLLEAARLRGADPVEVRIAARALTDLLVAPGIGDPDPGATLTVDRTDDHTCTFRFSTTPRPIAENTEDPVTAFKRAMDVDAQLQDERTAAKVALERTDATRDAGAQLYLTDIGVEDVESALTHCADLVSRWLDGLADKTDDFKRRVHLAEGFYLSLAEALLGRVDARAVFIWNYLKSIWQTHFVGGGDLSEELHIPFRLPDSPMAESVQRNLMALEACHSNKALFELAIATALNEKTDWLASAIESDKQSELAWQRKRAIVAEGFLSGNHLPIVAAWPAGEIQGSYEQLRRRSARYQFTEACAHHWWKAYLSSATNIEAYATWTLFLRSADRRAWAWMGVDADAAASSGADIHWKMSHVRLNQGKLVQTMSTREKDFDDRFLDIEIRGGVGPWRDPSSASWE